MNAMEKVYGASANLHVMNRLTRTLNEQVFVMHELKYGLGILSVFAQIRELIERVEKAVENLQREINRLDPSEKGSLDHLAKEMLSDKEYYKDWKKEMKRRARQ